MLFILGTPLLLGSWAGLAASPFLMLLLAIRATAEEAVLERELPGYAAYATQVRYRLVPGLW